MSSKLLTTVGVFLTSLVFLNEAGCCKKPDCVRTVSEPSNPCGPSITELTAVPPDAKPGECYAKIYVPPIYKTVTERVLVREASERLETLPAEYEWVEERVLVKDASSEVVTIPAEFADRERTIETAPARTDWEIKNAADCDELRNQPGRDVYCLVKRPPQQKTVREHYQVKPAGVEEKPIPAEYQTVRRQRLVHAATTKRIPIPAEYADIERQVKVCDARIAWKRVVCDGPGSLGMEQPAPTLDTRPTQAPVTETSISAASTITPWWANAENSIATGGANLSSDTINAVKGALRKRGYKPGPNNGEIRARDLVAIAKFQRDRGLPVSDLDDQTMKVLNIGTR